MQGTTTTRSISAVPVFQRALMLSTYVQRLTSFSIHPRFRYVVGAIALFCSYILFLYRCVPPSTFEGFVDLPSFYAASIAVFRDHLSPYDVGRLTRINGLEFRTFPFLYPPPSVLLFLPLASVSLDEAKHFVTLFNHLILVPILLLIPFRAMRLSPTRDYWRCVACLLYPLFSYPLIISIRYGQVNVALLGALVGLWIAAKQAKNIRAGLCLCAAIICKTIPLLFLPMLLVTGRWRIIMSGLLCVSLACLLSLWLLPPGVWGEWLFRIAPSGGYMNEPFGLFPPAGAWNQSLNGIIARAFTQSLWSNPGFHAPLLGTIICYSGAVCIIGLSATLLYRVRRSPVAADLLVVVTLPTIFLTAPFSWEHHIVYLLPTILFALCHEPSWTNSWRIPLFVASSIIAISFTIPALLFYRFASVVALWVTTLLITWKYGADARRAISRER